MRFLSGHKGAVNAVAYSPDGGLMATGSDDKTLQLWNPVSGAWKRTKHTNGPVRAISFHSAEPYLVFACGEMFSVNNAIQSYSWSGSPVLAPVAPIDLRTGSPFGVGISQSGDMLLSLFRPDRLTPGDPRRVIRGWSFTRSGAGQVISELLTFRTDTLDVRAAVFARAGGHAILGTDRGLWVLPLTPDAAPVPWPFPDITEVDALAVPPARDRVAFAGGGTVGVRPFAMQDAALHWTRPADSVVALAFTPCGRSLLGGGDDGLVTVWDAATGAEHHRLDFGLGPVRGVAANPDGLTAAACGDRGVVVFDLN